jgi:2-haloacid dehalogenase
MPRQSGAFCRNVFGELYFCCMEARPIEKEEVAKPKAIVFDVYDTLLTMTPVERKVNELMDNKRGYRVWFELFMQHCFVDNCTNQYHPFNAIAGATLKMAARMFNRSVDEFDVSNTLGLLGHLPLHEGVSEGLSNLTEQHFALAALTNAPHDLIAERMERTGLVSYFEKLLAAESVKKYKPCGEVYEWAAGELGVGVGDVLFVSSHGWDIAGAASAGMQTAYLLQPDELFYPLAPAPNFVAKNLEALAQELKQRFR